MTNHPKQSLARPTPEQVAWQDLELGTFIHFAPNTWQDRPFDDHSTPLSAINPAQLDTDQWADVAVSAGSRYVVLVAKHVGGFCLWQTDTNPYSIRHTPWRGGKGDIVADLARSCAKRGLKFGVYLSPQDESLGASVGGRTKDPAAQARYNAIFRRQLTELLTRYGPIVEIWFDGSLVVPVADIIRTQAPAAMVFQSAQATIRWVGNESGLTPYPSWNAVRRDEALTGIATAANSDPDGEVWLPIEADTTLTDDWFWRTDNAHKLKSLGMTANLPQPDGCVAAFVRTDSRHSPAPDRGGRSSRESHATERVSDSPAGCVARESVFRSLRRRPDHVAERRFRCGRSRSAGVARRLLRP